MLTPSKVEKDLSNQYYVTFNLASGDVIQLFIGWSDDDNRGWRFGISVNKEGRQDWASKAGCNNLYQNLIRASESVGLAFTFAEISSISKYILEHKDKTYPTYRASDIL